MLTLLGGFSLLNLFPSSRLARWFSIDARRLQRSYDRMQHIIGNVIEGKQQAERAACDVACCADNEDLVDVLLRLQKEDSSESPLTRESIFAVLIVSIFNHLFLGSTKFILRTDPHILFGITHATSNVKSNRTF
jgi:hypothetical protein